MTRQLKQSLSHFLFPSSFCAKMARDEPQAGDCTNSETDSEKDQHHGKRRSSGKFDDQAVDVEK
jgi:hypothetical protein